MRLLQLHVRRGLEMGAERFMKTRIAESRASSKFAFESRLLYELYDSRPNTTVR